MLVLFTTVVTSVVGITVMFGFLVGSFLRETTGLPDRWTSRTAAERIAEISQPILDQYENTPGKEVPTNIIPGSGPEAGTGNLNIGPYGGSTGDINGDGIPNINDHDGDGISNDDEINGGNDQGGIFGPTDPTNPDTDGDGVDDGTETTNGTDPRDPKAGGVTVPPRGTGDQNQEQGLVILDFSKTVRGTNNQFTHRAIVRSGSTVKFRINLDAAAIGSLQRVQIRDDMGRGLQYVPGSGSLQRTDAPPTPLPDNWISGLTLDVPVGYRSYVIEFDAVAVQGNSEVQNIAAVAQLGSFTNTQTDRAFVLITESPFLLGSPDGDGSNIYVEKFSKQIKDNLGNWTEYATITTNVPSQFRIVLQLINPTTTDIQAVIKDVLPSTFNYSAGTSKVYIDNSPLGNTLPDDWFTEGFTLTVAPGIKKVEIQFPATLEVPTTASNQANLTVNIPGSTPIIRRDSAILVRK